MKKVLCVHRAKACVARCAHHHFFLVEKKKNVVLCIEMCVCAPWVGPPKKKTDLGCGVPATDRDSVPTTTFLQVLLYQSLYHYVGYTVTEGCHFNLFAFKFIKIKHKQKMNTMWLVL